MPNNVPTAFWRIGICDLSGTLLTLVTTVATQKQIRYPLCRPSSLTFQVPSSDPHVNVLHTDGQPYLSCGNRVIKAWRRMEDETTWTIKYAGIVWSLQDSGDGTATYTSVTAYDPFQLLTKRVIRASVGTFHEDVSFALQHGELIAKAIVNRTIVYGGPCGIDDTSGTFTSSPLQSAEWTQQYVATGLIDLCDTGKLDVWFDPVDQTDGTLVWMNAGPARGNIDVDADHPLIAFAAPGHSAFSLDRSVSMDNFANSLFLYPVDTDHTVVTADDTGSQTDFYTYEDVSVITDISDPALVQLLANEQVAMRASPRDLLTLMPIPEKPPICFRDYFVGDLVNVAVSVGAGEHFPSARQKLLGLQRIFGITIDVDDNGVERVSGLDFSPQTGVTS